MKRSERRILIVLGICLCCLAVEAFASALIAGADWASVFFVLIAVFCIASARYTFLSAKTVEKKPDTEDAPMTIVTEGTLAPFGMRAWVVWRNDEVAQIFRPADETADEVQYLVSSCAVLPLPELSEKCDY